jgi:hypothetical protein
LSKLRIAHQHVGQLPSDQRADSIRLVSAPFILRDDVSHGLRAVVCHSANGDGAKDGSGLATVLEDSSVVISIALQHGIPAAALAKSVARMPATTDGLAVKAASPIGAVLDLLAEIENPCRRSDD